MPEISDESRPARSYREPAQVTLQSFNKQNATDNNSEQIIAMASPKVVLITGGNSGVGYEAVKIFLEADKPYHVLLGARSLEKATDAVESIKKECPGAKNTVEALALDVTSDESIKKAFEQVEASPGHVDALINNAGTHPSLYLMIFH